MTLCDLCLKTEHVYCKIGINLEFIPDETTDVDTSSNCIVDAYPKSLDLCWRCLEVFEKRIDSLVREAPSPTAQQLFPDLTPEQRGRVFSYITAALSKQKQQTTP